MNTNQNEKTSDINENIINNISSIKGNSNQLISSPNILAMQISNQNALENANSTNSKLNIDINSISNSNFNINNSSVIKKKKSQSIIDSKTCKEVDVILDLYTKILRKEDAEKCLCRNDIPEPEEFNITVNKKKIFYEREIISSLNFIIYQNDKIKLFDVISMLKICGFPLTGSMISIYSHLAEDYVFVGADPIDQNFFISSSEYNIKLIKLRVVAFIEENLIQDSLYAEVGACKESLSNKNSNLEKKKNKRTKERKIGFIIEKVNSWRKLYNGFNDENGKFTKYSLDEASKIIGISRKSLDDYLLQLRLGRKFGFDFNSNKGEKVGILRSFVKKNRNQKNE